MENGKDPSNHEEEVKGLNVNMGDEKTKSNGCYEPNESLDMVESTQGRSFLEGQKCQ